MKTYYLSTPGHFRLEAVLDELNRQLLPHDPGFGYRVVDETVSYWQPAFAVQAVLRDVPLLRKCQTI